MTMLLPGFAKSPETIGGRTEVEVGETVEESTPLGRAVVRMDLVEL